MSFSFQKPAAVTDENLEVDIMGEDGAAAPDMKNDEKLEDREKGDEKVPLKNYKPAEEKETNVDTPLKIDVTTPTTGTVKFLSPNKPVEEMENVEEFFVKYKNL